MHRAHQAGRRYIDCSCSCQQRRWSLAGLAGCSGSAEETRLPGPTRPSGSSKSVSEAEQLSWGGRKRSSRSYWLPTWLYMAEAHLCLHVVIFSSSQMLQDPDNQPYSDLTCTVCCGPSSGKQQCCCGASEISRALWILNIDEMINAYACCCWARDPLINPTPPVGEGTGCWWVLSCRWQGSLRQSDASYLELLPLLLLLRRRCCSSAVSTRASPGSQAAKYLNKPGEKTLPKGQTFTGVCLCRDPVKMVRRSLENAVRNQKKNKERCVTNLFLMRSNTGSFSRENATSLPRLFFPPTKYWVLNTNTVIVQLWIIRFYLHWPLHCNSPQTSP